jgi:hypothetical protein
MRCTEGIIQAVIDKCRMRKIVGVCEDVVVPHVLAQYRRLPPDLRDIKTLNRELKAMGYEPAGHVTIKGVSLPVMVYDPMGCERDMVEDAKIQWRIERKTRSHISAIPLKRHAAKIKYIVQEGDKMTLEFESGNAAYEFAVLFYKMLDKLDAM